jgi:hypothetical protein
LTNGIEVLLFGINSVLVKSNGVLGLRKINREDRKIRILMNKFKIKIRPNSFIEIIFFSLLNFVLLNQAHPKKEKSQHFISYILFKAHK